MDKAGYKRHMVEGFLLPLALVCLFAFCSLALGVMGGRAYKAINESIDDSYGSVVTANYLRTKLLQNNRQGAISIEEENGVQVLRIVSQQGGQPYETCIFVYDGALRESYGPVGNELVVESGVEIAKIAECRFSMAGDGLFEAAIVSPAGVHTRTVVALVQGAGL